MPQVLQAVSQEAAAQEAQEKLSAAAAEGPADALQELLEDIQGPAESRQASHQLPFGVYVRDLRTEGKQS